MRGVHALEAAKCQNQQMTMPLARLFPLDLVKGFVAVGRHMSITLAAGELCLSQSAVSRQIQSLEEHLGVRLFVRRHRGLAFTPEGERLFRSADAAVQQLQDTAAELRRSGERRCVTISASIGVAGLWLLPRLGSLLATHPGLDVRLSASNHLADLRGGDIDLAVRYAPADAVPADAERLFGETLAPVAHPSLGSDLNGLPLVEFDDARPWLQWRAWLDARGWKLARQRGLLRFNQYDQVIQAALAGQGAAVGRLELIQPLLSAGQLAVLQQARPEVASPCAYWLLQAQPQPRGDVQRVVDWIRAEAAQVRARQD